MAEETNNTKKWLLWGCGGCLGLVVIIGIVAAVAGASCVGGLQKASSDTLHKVFGDKYEAPAGVIPFSIPMGEANMVTLTDASAERMMVAVDTAASEEELKKVAANDPALLEEMANESSGNSSGKMEIQEHHPVTLANGKTILVGVGTATKSGDTQPAVMTILPQNTGRMVVVIQMSMAEGGDPAETQKQLEEAMLKVISDSELDERIP